MYHQILPNLDVKWTPLKTHYQMDYRNVIHFKWQLNVSFKMSILNLLTLWLQPTHNINCNPLSSKRVLILYNTRKWTVVAYTTILPFYLYFYSGKTPLILDINAKMRSYSLSQTSAGLGLNQTEQVCRQGAGNWGRRGSCMKTSPLSPSKTQRP